MNSGNAPLVVEVPDSAGVGAGVAIRGDGLEEEFDWLNEGLEGEDFTDDIFGESSPPHTMPLSLILFQPLIHLAQAMVLLQT